MTAHMSLWVPYRVCVCACVHVGEHQGLLCGQVCSPSFTPARVPGPAARPRVWASCCQRSIPIDYPAPVDRTAGWPKMQPWPGKAKPRPECFETKRPFGLGPDVAPACNPTPHPRYPGHQGNGEAERGVDRVKDRIGVTTGNDKGDGQELPMVVPVFLLGVASAPQHKMLECCAREPLCSLAWESNGSGNTVSPPRELPSTEANFSCFETRC
ncbi:uncharacterized protein P884DRAFT_263064 [Thermothelomyces heterothallicus CBS 202.75]|uniref:uncharacterized protein n=1 Tax=Thermothelomyces heterothallicus CBS 202.75 TaxID=1149848 RepID=UPI00374299A0